MRLFFIGTIYLYCLIPYLGIAQHTDRFTLVVNINLEAKDTIYAGESHFLEQYKSAKFFRDSISADHSKFIFTGELLYPTAIRVFSLNNNSKINQLIFIEPGYQEIKLQQHDTTVKVSSFPATKIMQEYQDFLLQVGVPNLDSKVDETKLYNYVKDHPDSYIALFCIIFQTFNYNFTPGLKRIASQFNDTIKSTKGYRYFADQYLLKKKIPLLTLSDENGKQQPIDFERTDGKFTFLEFWFTGCTGCIPAMQYLKQHFNELSNKVQVITICTDPKIIPSSLNLLQKLNLPWENYWDYGATQLGRFTNLYIYPANLLIDNEGYTVGKDIVTSEIFSFISR